jgi:hypothetical protein
VQSIFLSFDPIAGMRRVSGRDSRTRVDWAEEVRRLLEEDDPGAREVELVCDDWNTPTIASLCAAFPAEEAPRQPRRPEIPSTPRDGSRLKVAEIELSVLSRLCLDRRIATAEELAAEGASWQRRRKARGSRVVWRFTTADARVKLQHLYPRI